MTLPSPQPIPCRPVLKSKIWGGRKLEALFNFDLPEDEKIGEAWIVADLPEGASTAARGPLAGTPLSEIAKAWGEDLIGPAWQGKPTGGRFPLLIKFLDAQDDLSVQVHPDEEACRTDFPNDFSKDESWVVIDAEPGGSILHGFEPGATLKDFDREIADGDVASLMRRVEVSPGQVYRVSPRTVHALCQGVVILEIQEPSDSTFRIYDYNRLGDDGKPRDLHLDAARKVMRFGDDTPPEVAPTATELAWGCHELLLDVPAYRIERLHPSAPVAWDVDPQSAQVLIVLRGSATLNSMGLTIEADKGDAVIIPAVAGKAELTMSGDNPLAVMAGAGHIPMVHDPA